MTQPPHGGYKKEFCLCQAPLGAPAAAQFLDSLIACGCQKIVSAGSCGVLADLPENEFLVPVKALRDEGTSYHYLPVARYIELDESARAAIDKNLQRFNQTTTAPFQLSLAIGSAKYDGRRIEGFLNELDRNMYTDKKRYHEEHPHPEGVTP